MRRKILLGLSALLAAGVLLFELRLEEAKPVLSLDHESQQVLPSGKDLKVRVELGDEADRSSFSANLNGEDVTRRFRFHADAAVATVPDLRRGENELSVSVRDRAGAQHDETIEFEASGKPAPSMFWPEFQRVAQAVKEVELSRNEISNPSRDLASSAKLAKHLFDMMENAAQQGERHAGAAARLIDLADALPDQLENTLAMYDELRDLRDGVQGSELDELGEVVRRAADELDEIFRLGASGDLKDVRSAKDQLAELMRDPTEPSKIIPENYGVFADVEFPISFGMNYARSPQGGGGAPDQLLAEAVSEPANRKAAWFDTPVAHAQGTPPELCPSTGVDFALPGTCTPDPDHPIVKKAQELNNDPVAIYEFVRNEIEFDVYAGMSRGSTATLLKRAGNDADTAALLVALLRAAGYKARFVVGDITIKNAFIDPEKPAQLESWYQMDAGRMGNVMKWWGLPAQGIGGGYAIYDHWWVKAELPYGPDQGRSLDAPKRWIFLDASYKLHDRGVGGGDPAGVYLGPPTSVYNVDSYVNSIDHLLPIERYLDARRSLFSPGMTVADVRARGPIIREEPGVLPASLPYKPINYHTEFADVEELPDGDLAPGQFDSLDQKDLLRPRLFLRLRNGQTPILEEEFIAADIATRRVTVGWRVHPSDETLFNTPTGSGGCSGDLGMCATPSQIQVYPRVYLDGVTLKESTSSFTLGHALKATVGSSSAFEMGQQQSACTAGGIPRFTKRCQYNNKELLIPLEAGSRWALATEFGQAGRDLIDRRIAGLIERYEDIVGPAHPGVPGMPPEEFPLSEQDWEDLVGELLYITALRYGERLHDANSKLAEMERLSIFSEGVGQAQAKTGVTYFYGTPVTVVRGPYLMDLMYRAIPRVAEPIFDGGGQVDVDAINQLETYAFKLIGWNGSALEHQVPEEITQVEAVSSVKALQVAKDSGTYVKYFPGQSSPSIPGCTGMHHVINGHLASGFTVHTSTQVVHEPGWDFYGCGFLSEKIGTSIGNGAILIAAISGGQPAKGVHQSCWEQLVCFNDTEDIITYSPIGADFSEVRSGDPVSIVSGNMDHTELDFRISTRGPRPVEMERTYNSKLQELGPFGYGWTHTYNIYLEAIDDDVDGEIEKDESDPSNDDDVDGVVSGVAFVDGKGSRIRFAAPSGLGGSFTTESGNQAWLSNEAGVLVLRVPGGLEFRFPLFAGSSVGDKTYISSTTDPNGNAFSFTYSPPGRLVSVWDPLNRALLFWYTSSECPSCISAVADWTGRFWNYTYDSNQDLIHVVNPFDFLEGRNTWTHEYYHDQANPDNNHNLKKYYRGNDPSAGMTFDYYTNDKAYRHVDGLGAETRFSYNLFRRETLEIDPLGGITRFQFDDESRLTRVIRPDGAIEDFEYFPEGDVNEGRLKKEIDPLGYETTFTYDANGFGYLKTETHAANTPEAATTSYQYYYEVAGSTPPTEPRHGLVIRETDARGNKFRYAYNQAGNLHFEKADLDVGGVVQTVELRQYVTDPWGNVTKMIENIDATTPTINEATDRVTTFNYDANGYHLEEVVDTFGNKARNVWDTELGEPDRGQLRRSILERSANYPSGESHYVELETEFLYDILGRQTEKISPVGTRTVTRFDYLGRADLIEVIGKDETGTEVTRKTTNTFDSMDRVVMTSDALGATTQFEYDLMGNLTKRIDARGDATRTNYDSRHRVIRTVDAMGAETLFDRDPLGRIFRTTDPMGNVSITMHDALSRVTRVIQRMPVDPQVALGDPDAPRWEPIDLVTEFDYDTNGNLVGVRDARLNALVELDANGEDLCDENGDYMRWVAWSVSEVTGDKQQDAFATDCILSNAQGNTATHEYDELDRLILSRNIYGDETEYEYDLLGNRTKLHDAKNQDTLWFHNREGWVDRRRDALGREEFLTHDSLGNMISRLDRDSKRVNLYYDFQNLNVSIVHEFDGREEAFGFDGFGNNILIRSPEVTYTASYDLLGRPVRRTDSRFLSALRFNYDALGNLVSRTDLEGNVTQYRYDSVGRLISVAVPDQGDVERYYDAAGRLIGERFPSGRYSQYEYDPAGRTAIMEQHKDSPVQQNQFLYQLEYLYDPNGNVTIMDRDEGAVPKDRFRYDGLNRVVTATYKDGSAAEWEERFAYDAVGNRIYHCDAPDAIDCDDGIWEPGYEFWMAYDANNRLTSRSWDRTPGDATHNPVVSETRNYDDEGRLTRIDDLVTSAWQTFGYSSASRLANVVHSNGDTWLYAYDAVGQRIWTQTPTKSRNYVWSSGNRVGEYIGGTLHRRFDHGLGLDDVIASIDQAGDVAYHQKNASRSTMVTSSDNGGSLCPDYDYKAFGEKLSGFCLPGAENELTYIGREEETNGLLYLRARYYDPAIGRFLTEDPLGIAGSGVNLYAYAANNPLALSDPTGLKPASDFDRDNSDEPLAGERFFVGLGSFFEGVASAPGKIKDSFMDIPGKLAASHEAMMTSFLEAHPGFNNPHIIGELNVGMAMAGNGMIIADGMVMGLARDIETLAEPLPPGTGKGFQEAMKAKGEATVGVASSGVGRLGTMATGKVGRIGRATMGPKAAKGARKNELEPDERLELYQKAAAGDNDALAKLQSSPPHIGVDQAWNAVVWPSLAKGQPVATTPAWCVTEIKCE